MTAYSEVAFLNVMREHQTTQRWGASFPEELQGNATSSWKDKPAKELAQKIRGSFNGQWACNEASSRKRNADANDRRRMFQAGA